MNSEKFSFELITQDENARLGKILTPRGDIDTPAFMPVGTLGTVKGIFTDDILLTGSQIILGNTYHLMIRPGTEVLDQFGGLHNYMNWQKPILTDSGGFQIMSLSKLNKIDIDVGAIFSSHVDGKKFILSPEKSIQIQKSINSDILMVLDECPRSTIDLDKIKNAITISTAWAKRSKIEFGNNSRKALFGIIQGGLDQKLRLDSLEKLVDIGFDGYAMGGLAVGESQSEMFAILNKIVSYMPKKKPRYLMGVGTPADILGAVKSGIDMFDCVLPTRNARNGQLFTSEGVINIRNAEFKNSDEPIDKNCENKVSQKYSRAYLNHLQRTNEMLGSMLATYHNIYYYQSLMKGIRDSIKNNLFAKFVKDFYNKRNLDVPEGPL